MKYQSTRNRALTASPAAAVLRGIAPDGGLYMPEAIPVLNWQSLLEADTLTLSARILSALLIWTVWSAGATPGNLRRRS